MTLKSQNIFEQSCFNGTAELFQWNGKDLHQSHFKHLIGILPGCKIVMYDH